jgi:hypothetical protein
LCRVFVYTSIIIGLVYFPVTFKNRNGNRPVRKKQREETGCGERV